MRRVGLALLMVLAACSRSTPPPSTVATNPEISQVARDFCPVLLQWQRTVAGAMNTMSKATVEEPDPAVRVRHYQTAFLRARDINEDLEQEMLRISRGAYVDDLVVEVLDGLALAGRIIDAREEWTTDLHESGSPTYRDVVPVIFSDFEKVVEVVKPELSRYSDPELISSFAAVEDCRYGVHDVPRDDSFFAAVADPES